MQWKNNTSALGLDIGQNEVKAILLERRGGTVHISRRETFSLWEEGLLDEKELYASLNKWLREQKLLHYSSCVGLPQFLTTPQISDFPPDLNADTLKTLVRNETAQLSGLSDERFIYDYQVMAPLFGRKNPVLIGICRESAVEEQFERLRGIEVNVQDMGMNGIALVNAFYHLQPKEKENPAIQVLLDLGSENSTLAVVARGQLLYISSLMFGSRRFSALLAEELGCKLEEAERQKYGYKADWQNPECALLPAVQQLVNEMSAALEHWRESESGELHSKPLGKIWLAGGGARLWGLNAQLIRAYSCPVELLGLRESSTQEPDPTMLVALGLALQGIGEADCNISLIPELLRWQQSKMARLSYLRASAAILISSILVFMLWFFFHIRNEQNQMNSKIDELSRCTSLLPRLEEAQRQIGFYQMMMIPLVEAGSRTQNFLNTLQELQQAMAISPEQVDGWCIYVADYQSYMDSAKIVPEKKEAAATPTRREPGLFSAAKTSTNEPEEENKFIPVLKIPQLEKMIAGGYSVVPPQKGKFEATKEILDKINASGFFAGADWFSEWDETHSLKIFKPWLDIVPQNNSKKKDQINYYDFRIQLPFAKQAVNKPPPEPPKPARRRRR